LLNIYWSENGLDPSRTKHTLYGQQNFSTDLQLLEIIKPNR